MKLDVPNNVVEVARKIATRSNMHQKVGAVVYKKDRVISTGYNRWLRIGHVQSHSTSYTRYSIHAEEDALLGARPKDCIGASIYIYRNGGGLAKPCEKCQAMLTRWGITQIQWSDSI